MRGRLYVCVHVLFTLVVSVHRAAQQQQKHNIVGEALTRDWECADKP